MEKLEKLFFFSRDNFVSSTKTSNFAAAKGGERAPCLAPVQLGYGVIGNTTDSGPVILGSSPDIPTMETSTVKLAFFIIQVPCSNKNYHYICTQLEDL